ncbi:MAG: Ppx/GppA phosphatase family protein [Pararhizobium sp.]
MTDPDHGSMPSEIGAPAKRPSDDRMGGAPDGGRSKGEEARSAGPAGSASNGDMRRSSAGVLPAISASAPAGDARDKAESQSPHHAHRKRKRRRRPHAGKPVEAGAGERAAEAPRAASEDQGQSGRGRRGKNRSKRRRAPQGRPLACGAPSRKNEASMAERPPAIGHPPASGPNAKAAPAHADSRLAASTGPGERSFLARMPAAAGGEAPLPLYAALDLGTNNCRLLIAQPTRPGQFRVVDAFSRIVRLGEGLVGSGRLSDAAMDRAIEALKVCAGKLRNRPIRNSRLIATEACRAAENGTAFLARVRAETGLDLEIVDRETEARLAVSGCASLVERDARAVVLFDIGGGSSEIAVIELAANRSNRLSNHIKAWTSLPVGVVTLSEQHGGREVTQEVFAAMVGDVEAMLARFDCPGSITGHHGGDCKGFHLLGTSGTVTTLAGVYLDLPRYDRRRVDGLWLTSADVDAMRDRLLSWNFDQRSANPCIGADRADLVLAGCAILEAIRRRWPAERMRVADRGLREGLLTEMMAADGVWRRHRRGRRVWRGQPA